MSKVKVTADKHGNVIGVSMNNPEYGYIRVEQIVLQINNDGWLRRAKRSALIKGKVEDLVECNYKENDEIPGQIIVKESLTPFNPQNPDKDLKIAGETGLVCRIDDQPIYRQSFYTTNLSLSDELLTHNNSGEIKDYNQAKKVLDGLKEKEVSL